ncbi:hypothetical protein BDR22DRAFT_889396 [Usnea florida]
MQFFSTITAIAALSLLGLTNATPTPEPQGIVGTPPLNGGCNTQHWKEGEKCYAVNEIGCSVNGWDLVKCDANGNVDVIQHCGRSSCHYTLSNDICYLSC